MAAGAKAQGAFQEHSLIASLGTPMRATRAENPNDLLPGETIQTARPSRVQHDLAGYGRLLSAMKFMRRAIEQEHFPSARSVVDHFGVSIATAYRWTAALAEAYGIDPAVRYGGKS